MPDNAAAPQGTAVATRDNSPVGQFQRQLETRARDIQMALPSHISLDKFQRTILTAVAQNPELLSADRNSLILSCYKAAQDGLLLDGREAVLVTFNTRFKDSQDGQWKSRKLVQYMPMVFGLRKKVLQSGEIVDLFASVVFKQEIEAGRFIYEEGTERMLRHKPILEPDFAPSDDDIAIAYSVATFKDGTKSFEVMFRRDINKVRQCSQTGALGRTDRSGKAIEAKGPWVDWFPEQAKKSAIRRHTKTLPMSSDVFIDVEGREQLEYGSSAALALGSQAPDAPRLIADQTSDDDETPHDPETGEITEQPETAKLPEEAAAETQPAKRGRPPKVETPAAGKPEATAASANASDDNAGAPAEVSADSGTDQLGITKDPAEDQADEFLGRFKNAENVIDLESAHDEFERVSEGWPYEIVQAVESGYQRHRRRLGAPAAAQSELAE